MISYITINDNDIFAVNRGKQANVSNEIIYRDRKGKFHSIDFAVCAENFKKENPNSSGVCIGERNSTDSFFVFYTSGLKTKIIFKKLYVFSFNKIKLLTGTKHQRFSTLQKLIRETKYTTFDLT